MKDIRDLMKTADVYGKEAKRLIQKRKIEIN